MTIIDKKRECSSNLISKHLPKQAKTKEAATIVAASFAAYVTGKTADEVAGIAVNEKTAPTDADLSSSVTIAIGGFQALIDKALE